MEWIPSCPRLYLGHGMRYVEDHNLSEDTEAPIMPGRGPWALRAPESEDERKRRRRTVSQDPPAEGRS